MASNPLDPSALISALPDILPPTKKKLESPQDAIAVLIHTAFMQLGFRLIAVDEASPARSILNSVLPDEWNQHSPGNYTFRYKHEQSSLEFIVKVIKLGSRTLVNSVAIESDKAASLDIATNDFTSPSFFPHDLSAPNAPPLVHGFISSNRVIDLTSQLTLKIFQKLVPGLRKEGYTEHPATSTTASSSQPPREQDPPPARPYPADPPYPPQRSPLQMPPRNPFEIGRSDLDPLGRNPFAPPPLFPSHGGDGMFVGPEHPIFGSGVRGPGLRSPFGERGPWGGDGFLPPMGAPPGARFDPIGPSSGPGATPFRGLPGRGNPNDPDNDEFMPPGADNMYM